MQTKTTILINNSQDWANKLHEETDMVDDILNILKAAGLTAEMVKLKNHMEGAEDWCKECGHRISDHRSGLCLRCREDRCNECEIPNHARFQECKDKG